MENILRAIENKKQKILALLERLVNVDSALDNPAGLKKCAEIVGGKLSELGFGIEYFDYPGVCAHVLGRKKGGGSKRVMLTGHLDTIFLVGTAAKRPFTIKSGRAYGPGVADMKGGVAMALFVLEAMHEQGWNDHDITVFFCGDEETGHPKTNAPEIFMREGNGQDGVFCLEPGRPNGEVVIGRKGVMIPEMTITGVSAHAAEPTKGASAIHEMIQKACDIYNLQNTENGILCNVGIIKGGTGASVVADNSSLRFSIRFDKIVDGEKLLSAIREIASKVYVPGTQTALNDDRFLYLPFETTDDVKKMLALVRRSASRLGLPEIGALFQFGGSDACWTAQAGAPTICGMGPVGGFFHNEREYIDIAMLMERAKLLALCMDAVR
jgi:glutamate carboxypeptidase